MPCSLVFPPKKSISNLQLLQNSAARVLTGSKGWEHIIPVLKSLHWLPVCFWIDFKVLLLVFKCLNGLGPSHLSDLLWVYQPSWTLRSCSTGILNIQKIRSKTHREAFIYCGPQLWNSLRLRVIEAVVVFKKRFLIWEASFFVDFGLCDTVSYSMHKKYPINTSQLIDWLTGHWHSISRSLRFTLLN